MLDGLSLQKHYIYVQKHMVALVLHGHNLHTFHYTDKFRIFGVFDIV